MSLALMDRAGGREQGKERERECKRAERLRGESMRVAAATEEELVQPPGVSSVYMWHSPPTTTPLLFSKTLGFI